ncbi:MAG: molybdate ABC transporter periplasmic substrate-binding protein [Bacteroidetes bacterium ADurb.Bin408]|nr:MAG: molybdate ABC transporter periplasmic substrate-binding protein [Bacteroidetes bacterium ADurb.Bin408]
MMYRIKRLSVIFITVFLAVSCGYPPTEKPSDSNTDKTSGELIIFHAGSLSVPFKSIIEAFNKDEPGIKVLTEAAGSVECARKISELNKPCDIFASSDIEVIDNNLIPVHAKWSLKFAANEMVIAFNEKSRRQQEINKDNWYRILTEKDVAYGRADPNADPCGYRSIFTLLLSEKYYGNKGLAEELIKKDTKHIRPKEVDLLALLESHTLDYIFIYRSVAEQHQLKYITLPDEVNLKKPEMDSLYHTVHVEVMGQKPGEKKTINGSAIVYGLTIPENAPHKSNALLFLEFLLDASKGMIIMEKNGQTSLVPTETPYYNELPERIKPYALMPPNEK